MSLETTGKTEIDLEELKEKLEVTQYFSNLYKVRLTAKPGLRGRLRMVISRSTLLQSKCPFKSQLREKVDEIEDAREDIGKLKDRINKLEEDKRLLIEEARFNLQQKEQEKERIHHENDVLIRQLR